MVRVLNKSPGVGALYPKDHYCTIKRNLINRYPWSLKKMSLRWTINGGVWRKDLSKERAAEIGLARS